MSRKLIIYYSRSHATQKLAAELVKDLGADVVALQEQRSRAGMMGFMRSLWDASRSVLPPIAPLYIDPSHYDLILLGTPVWAGRAACPMRRFLCDAAHRLPPTAYFCTYGGRGYETTFRDMCALDGKAPIATLAIRRTDLLQGLHTEKLDRFVAKLNIAERWGEIVDPATHSVPLHGR
jgi:hypothetical protein